MTKEQIQCIEEVLLMLYPIQEVLEFDYTIEGEQIGMIINKLQHSFLTSND